MSRRYSELEEAIYERVASIKADEEYWSDLHDRREERNQEIARLNGVLYNATDHYAKNQARRDLESMGYDPGDDEIQDL